jgi:hypothetical protein
LRPQSDSSFHTSFRDAKAWGIHGMVEERNN